MSRIKSAIKGIPRLQPEEEVASDKQIGYLRSFGYFSEKLISNLGMWQASYLIDKAIQIKESEESEEDEPRQLLRGKTRKSKNGGCGCLLLVGVALFAGAASVKNCGSDKNAFPTPSLADAEIAPRIPTRPKQAEIETSPPVDQPAPYEDSFAILSEKTTAPPRPGLGSFDGLHFPLSIVAIEPFSLLDKAGKETAVAVGTLIQIISRTEKGTLTMEIGGSAFVGNEGRLFYKVKAQEPSGKKRSVDGR